MSYGINKVIIMGHLGRDPELEYHSKKKTTALISVATNKAIIDKHTGERRIITQWHRICFFGRLAEVVSDLLYKGCHVYIEGFLSSHSWQDDEGQKHTIIRIVGQQLQLLSAAKQEKRQQNDDSQE
ncbi:MAG: single-stranded DNA-binding protein [Gammaproteobacteria bacterium]